MGGRRWTDPEDAVIREMTAIGTLHSEIAERIGRTIDAVRSRAHSIGAVTPPDLAMRNSHAGNRAMHADPARRRAKLAKIRAAFTPERRQRQAEIARKVNAERDYSLIRPETRVALSKGLREYTARRLSWLPDDRREEYARLVSRKGAVEAKRLILESMTPFERQMQAVKQGRGLVAAFKAPTKSYDFTLGGVSPVAGG